MKKLFNVFAISNVFVISLAFICSLSFEGRGSLVLFLDKMSFNVFHVFLISYLNFLNVISKYNVLAVRMLCFNMLFSGVARLFSGEVLFANKPRNFLILYRVGVS